MIQVNRIYLIFNRLVTKKFLVDTSGIGTYLIGQLTPWMLQNLTPAGTFFLFAAMCVPYMLIVWKLVPETTGKSLEEIERYWTRMK